MLKGANPRFIVVNVPGDPQGLHEDVYCQRGEMENRIKEQPLDLFADRAGCHRFGANQFRLLLSAAAYVLVQALRRTMLLGTEWTRAQVGTIRLKLFKVAAQVVISARRVVLRLASSYPCLITPSFLTRSAGRNIIEFSLDEPNDCCKLFGTNRINASRNP